MHRTYEYCRDDWTERRKRLLLLSALRRPHYRRAFEAGCAFGHLTQSLAQRCDEVIAADADEAALAQARALLAPQVNVYLSTMHVPQVWPLGHFDLIVLGEFIYHLSRAQIRQLALRAQQSLDPNGEIVACHSRLTIPGTGLSGDEAHAELHTALPLQYALRHQEADFILETWSRESPVALSVCAA